MATAYSTSYTRYHPQAYQLTYVRQLVRSCLPASAYHEQDTKLRPLDDALAARLQRRGGPAALIAARWAAEDGLVNSDTLSAHPRAEDGAHALRRSV